MARVIYDESEACMRVITFPELAIICMGHYIRNRCVVSWGVCGVYVWYVCVNVLNFVEQWEHGWKKN